MTRARDLAAGTFELATGGVLKLETSDTTVTDGSVLGKIEFKAPDEASGTDAILVGAAIEAVAEGTFAADNNATELVFKTGASAAADAKMILDSSGNLLVGQSGSTAIDTSSTTTGYSFRADGRAAITRDSGIALAVNRLTNDGDLIEFKSDGTAVGSIGNRDSDDIFINTAGGTGSLSVGGTEYFAWSSGAIYPWTDNARNLGGSSVRFKDLYLSGGVFLGGTGAANKLDDYEEGTWTPTDGSGAGLTLSVNASSYTKIGRLCYIYTYITYPSTSNGSAQALGGLPFTTKGSATYAQLTVRVTSDTVSASNLTFQLTTSSTAGIIHDGAAVIVNSDLSAKSILISGCYEVA